MLGSGLANGDRTLKSLDRATAHGAFLGVVLLQGFWAVIDANELAWLPAGSAGPKDSAALSVQSLQVGIMPASDASSAAMLSLAAAF